MTDVWERVCREDDLLPDQPHGVLVGDSGQDRDRVCVVRPASGEPVAMLDRCPHRDIALSGGIVKDGQLVCPGHFWRFDLASGRCTDRPRQSASVYPTRVVDGWVEALVPAPAAPLSMRERLLAAAASAPPRRSPVTAVATNPEIGETVSAGGIRTNHHDEGSGQPVLLVHGSGPGVSAFANWRLTLPALAQRFRVVAPDVLGFGYTERPPGTSYDVEAWVRHLVDYLDALELERVSVIGNSFGGALALHLATRFPERVDRLVLMGSVGTSFELTTGLDQVWGFEPSLPAMRELLEVFAHDTSLLTDDLAAMRLRAATRPGVHEAYRAMFPAPRQRSVDALAVDKALLRALPHRTLVVHGREDRVIPLSSSLRLHELVPDSQLHVFGNCGHWVQIEHAEEFNRLVTDFLR